MTKLELIEKLSNYSDKKVMIRNAVDKDIDEIKDISRYIMADGEEIILIETEVMS